MAINIGQQTLKLITIELFGYACYDENDRAAGTVPKNKNYKYISRKK